MVINITCLKIPGSGFIFAAFGYPSMTNDPFNDRGRGRGCKNFVPVLGRDGTKTLPTGDIFDQHPGEIS